MAKHTWKARERKPHEKTLASGVNVGPWVPPSFALTSALRWDILAQVPRQGGAGMGSLLSRWPDPRRSHRGVRLGLWVVGTAAASIGLASAPAAASRQRSLSKAVSYATLQFAPWPVGAFFLLGAGAALLVAALCQVRRWLPSMREPANHSDGLSVSGPRRAQISEAPRIVALGGGHGLSTLLRGLKNHATQLTAIVTVADGGGSSGVLRRELGLPPPGDLRNCIVALDQAEPLMTQRFQYRFGR